MLHEAEAAASSTSAIVAARRVAFDATADAELRRDIAVERPIALEFDGVGYAVMMATPADLQDFAVGFAFYERLVSDLDEIASIDVAAADEGHVVRVNLGGVAREQLAARVRLRVTEGSCGLCGLETIEQALRPLPPVPPIAHINRAAIARALGELPTFQELGTRTAAAHAAAFASWSGDILAVREDVGRHNALDKLIGAMLREGIDAGEGFLLLTARCAYELVEKAALAGCSLLATISAPTELAVARAISCGMTLAAVARHDNMLIFNDPAHAIQ